jgi:hypothetical protein
MKKIALREYETARILDGGERIAEYSAACREQRTIEAMGARDRTADQSSSQRKRVNCSVRICGQILTAKQEQAGFVRRYASISSGKCSNWPACG